MPPGPRSAPHHVDRAGIVTAVSHQTRPVRILGLAMIAAAPLLLQTPALSGAGTQPAEREPSPRVPGRDPNATIPTELRTIAERSSFKATALHADVVRLLDALAARSRLATRASMGTTEEGREIPLLVIADPPIRTAAEAREATQRGKLTVLMLGNIHAGEVDGKEALPVLARDLIINADAPRHRAWLDRLVLVFAPIYNADGNERVDVNNRPGQIGPEEGMGIRENARGLDLNRDFIKVEAAETRALVRFLVDWDPGVLIDTHTTNGSFHRYLVTYCGNKSPTGDAALTSLVRDDLLPKIAARFHEASGRDAFPYGNFEGEFSSSGHGWSRWESFPAEGRFGTTYMGLRNRIGILSEAYAYATFEERIVGTQHFVAACLDELASRAGLLGEAMADADTRAVRAGEAVGDDALDDAEPDAAPGATPDASPAGAAPVPALAMTVALRSRMVAAPGTVTVKGYEEAERGGRRVSTGTTRDYEVELFDRFDAELAVPRAWAYAIPPELRNVIDLLRRHGIEVRRVTTPIDVDAQVMTIEGVTQASRPFQGHVLGSVRVRRDARVKTIDRGWYIVPVAQPLGSLASYILEPESEDGVVTWNFMDTWVRNGAEYPIVRLARRAEIQTELAD